MKKKSPWSVFAAIILAIIVGCLTGKDAQIFGLSVYSIYDFVGTVFIKALSMVVIPLISSSIIIGMARMGADESFGKLGAKTFGFYLGTSLMAILIGLFFVNLIHPGSPELIEQLKQMPGNEMAATAVQPTLRVSDIFLQLVPSNIIEAFAKGQMLSVIFFCLIFGFTISKIENKAATTLISFGEGIFQTMIEITHLIMKFLPIGVFCLVAKVFASTGMSSLHSVALFTLSILLGLATFTFIGLPLLIKLVGRRNPILLFKAMMPALVTAFSTSSSSATLPITMDCVEKRAGVSNRICGLVVPLGTSINMCGSALYECAAAIFVAQAYGLDLSLSTQFLIVVMSLVTSMGVAGIPSGSTVAIIVILKTVGLPAEGIGLFLAVDRFLDMCRTTVNVFGDSCCAILVATTEGEKQVLTRNDLNYEISLR
jgi:proton glutamate symport protein